MSVALIIMGISIIVFLGVVVLFICKTINALANGIEEVNNVLEGVGKVYNESADGCKETIKDLGNGLNKAMEAYVPVLNNAAGLMLEASDKIANMKGSITITFGNDAKAESNDDIKYGDF